MLGYMGGDALKSRCFPSPMDDTRFDGPFQGVSGTSLGFPHGADGAISRVSNELELFTLRLHSRLFSIPQSLSRENDP